MRAIIVLLFIFISFLPTVAFAQPIPFSDSVEVSLLSCEPGDAVYARFGHTALRIRDNSGRDMSYNYGIFDFRTDNFYWKFLRGHTDYLLGVYPTEYFLEEYRERESTVWEQVLNLTTAEKQKLIALLNENYQPENRTYRYNFVFDNCATRPKVMLQRALSGELSYQSAYSSETYRQLISGYISNDAWLHLGINLIFGADAEQKAGQTGAAFLPLLLRDDLQNAKIEISTDGAAPRPLVLNTHTVAGTFQKKIPETPWWLHPLFFSLLWLGAGMVLTFRKHKTSLSSKSFDAVLYTFTALAGLLIFMLSFFSEHPLVGSNWNLLWLNPLNLLPAVWIWKRKNRKILLVYLVVSVCMVLMALVLFAFRVQTVPLAVLPLIVLVLIRTTRRVLRLSKRLIVRTSKGWKWKN